MIVNLERTGRSCARSNFITGPEARDWASRRTCCRLFWKLRKARSPFTWRITSMVSAFSSWMMAKCRNLRGREGKTPGAGECTAWGPGRRGLRGIAQGRGFWRPRPRCFPRGYYELSVPGRRPGTFRGPPSSSAGAGQTAPPSRRAGTPCTSPPGRAAPASGAETPRPLCKRGLRVPAAAPPPPREPGPGWGGRGRCARLQGRAAAPPPRDPTLTPPPPRSPPPLRAVLRFARPAGQRCMNPGPRPPRGPCAAGPASPPGPETLTSLRPR